MPLTFLGVEKVLMTYFMFVLLSPQSNEREQFQRKEGLSIDFQASCSIAAIKYIFKTSLKSVDSNLVSLYSNAV